MKKKVFFCGMLGLGACIALAGCGVEQTASEITVEAGSELHVHASDFLSVDFSKDHDVVIDASGVDTSKVGEYEVKATYKKDEFTLLVKVVDTTAPTVEMKEKILYTADLENETYESVVGSVEDASKYTISLKGTEKVGELSELNDEYVAGLEETFEMENMVEGIPSENGIYQGVIAIADEYSNSVEEKIYIVYDSGVVEDEAEDDEDVKAVDADNKEDKADKGTTNKSENSGSKDTNKNTSGNSDTKKPTNTSTNKNESSNKNDNSSTNSGNSGSSGNSNKVETPKEDTSSNNSSSEVEENVSMTPTEKAVVSAGYNRVVEDPAGGYAVMVNGANASKGRQLISSYLDSIGYEIVGSIGGGWIDADKGQYLVYVDSSNIQKKVNLDDEDVWLE